VLAQMAAAMDEGCDLPERLVRALVAAGDGGTGDSRCAEDGLSAASAYVYVAWKDGTGEAGFYTPDEVWPRALHDRAGLLCSANRGPNTNSAQFFVTDAAAPHLDKGYTIFGECAPLALVHKLASVPTTTGDKPTRPLGIRRVTISRR